MSILVANLIFWPMWSLVSLIPYTLTQLIINKRG